MRLEQVNTYEQLESFLRNFVNFHGDPAPYDFNGLLHLVLAGVDSLRENATEQDFLDFSASITDEQAEFLATMLSRRTESIRQLEEEA